MTITLGSWAIPAALSAVAWGWALFPRTEGDTYDVGAFLRGIGAIIATLVVFLVRALLR